jgi:predicted nucleotidyltransferase component of viral defense system
MDILRKHEIFEIEVLERLKNAGFLVPLVFTGGTMLRLCYELKRYSADLDFWFIRKIDQKVYFAQLKKYLSEFYDLTDARIKFNTLLVEIRFKAYPKRLIIEIRKEIKRCDFQERIAFSTYSTKQVVLKVHTLEQVMRNKIEAALQRKDIRDFFDLEFLLRQGVALETESKNFIELKKIIGKFKENDYRVTLGSVLDSATRKYYLKNRFDFLLRKINSAIGNTSV